MAVAFSHALRDDDAGAPLRDLDDVALLAPATTDDGDVIPAGTRGTIVGVWNGGEAFFVEFARHEGAPATVRLHDLERVGRHAP